MARSIDLSIDCGSPVVSRVTVGCGVVGEVLRERCGVSAFSGRVGCVVIADRVVWELYGDALFGGELSAVTGCVLVEPGEGSKSLAVVERVVGQLLEMGCDRNTFLIGLGGGVVCDITGFVASVFMRGVRFGFVATSLLAMVDASVGGKNGVNVGGYKNMVGVFSPPEFVVCDVEFLATLPSEQIAQGMAEVVKCALIEAGELREVLLGVAHSELYGRGGRCDISFMERVVMEAICVKVRAVESDFRDLGVRRLLNLGHTFGHAVERVTGGGWSHGQAVGLGLCMAAAVSRHLGMIGELQFREVLLLVRGVVGDRGVGCVEFNYKYADLEAELVVTYGVECDVVGLLIEAMRHDKKGVGELVLLECVTAGDAAVAAVSAVCEVRARLCSVDLEVLREVDFSGV